MNRSRLPTWARGGLWLVVFWLAALATHASGLYQPMHCDYSCRLRVARDWRQGLALYRQTYDNPNPVVFLWLLAIDSPRPAVSGFLAETALAAGAGLFLWAALARAVPRLAGVVPLVLIALSGASPTFYGGQIAEAPAMWLDVIAVAALWLALEGGGLALAALAGAAGVLVVALRFPAVLHVAAWLPLVVLHPGSRREQVRVVTAAALGACAALAAFVAHAQWFGYWHEFWVVFRRNLSYGALDRVPLADSVVAALKTLARIALANSLVVLLAVVAVAMTWSLRGRLRVRERAWLAASVVWLAAAIAGAFPGGRHYAHYYHLIWPPLAVGLLLWLPPLARLARRGALVDRLAAAIAAGTLLVAVLLEGWRGAQAVRDLHAGRHPWNETTAAAEWLEQHTTRDTPVLVHVWLDWAELYWRVPRPAPSLAIPHVVPRDLFGEFLQTTEQEMPAWIVWDGTPWEPIDGPLADETLLAARDRFVTRLERDYAERQRIGTLRILQRKNAR